MDIQVILVIILAILTINLVVVGVYFILILKEVREVVQKANNIVDRMGSITTLMSNPFSIFKGFLGAVMEGYNAIQEVRSIRSIRD